MSNIAPEYSWKNYLERLDWAEKTAILLGYKTVMITVKDYSPTSRQEPAIRHPTGVVDVAGNTLKSLHMIKILKQLHGLEYPGANEHGE